MDRDIKGEFGVAYVRAVAAAAGFFTQDPARKFDDDGIDITIMVPRVGKVRAPPLDVQVKTSANPIGSAKFPFDLPVKNYDELRDLTNQVPRVLVYVEVPPEQADWALSTPEHLLLRKCGYWLSLIGEPATPNAATMRVWLLKSALFHVDQLRAIMQRLLEGKLP